MIKFSKGKLSEIFNIKKEKLRYYSDIGLINPKKNKNNGYFEYDINDMFRLSAILRARYVGTSISKIKDVKKQGTVNAYSEFIDEQSKIIDIEISKLKEIQNIINLNKKVISELINFKNNLNYTNLNVSKEKKVFYIFDMVTAIEKAMKYKEFFNIYELENIYFPLNFELEDIFLQIDYIFIEEKINNNLLRYLLNTEIKYEKKSINGLFIKEKFLGYSNEIKEYILKITKENNININNKNIIINKLALIPSDSENLYFVEIFIEL